MNRIAVMAIAAAAVLGTVGGTYAATSGVFEGDKDNGNPTARPSDSTSGSPSTKPTKKPTQTPSTPDPSTDAPDDGSATDGELLYMEGGTIHDGDISVPVAGFRIADVMSLERVAGGWLVVERTSSQDAEFTGTFVDAKGGTTPIGTFVGGWDLNDDRDSLVSMFDGTYQVRDARSGAVITDIEPTGVNGPTGDAAFSEDTVVTGWETDQGRRLIAYEPVHGTQFPVVDRVYQVRGGPTQSLLVADDLDGNDGAGCLTGGPVTGGDSWWTQCKFRGYGEQVPFSPDGAHLLAIPSNSDGFGPGAYAILDATTGKKVARFDAPELAQDAHWASDDEVFVHAFADADFNGGVIYRCDFTGDCTKEVESDQSVVVGNTG